MTTIHSMRWAAARVALAGAAVAAAALAGACSNGHAPGTTDDIIGAPCGSDGDCAHRCLLDTQGNRFPSGFCTQSCTTSADCPSDSACVDVNGGVCMLVCPPFDCTFLGPGWGCRGRDLRAGGPINVCIGGG